MSETIVVIAVMQAVVCTILSRDSKKKDFYKKVLTAFSGENFGIEVTFDRDFSKMFENYDLILPPPTKNPNPMFGITITKDECYGMIIGKKEYSGECDAIVQYPISSCLRSCGINNIETFETLFKNLGLPFMMKKGDPDRVKEIVANAFEQSSDKFPVYLVGKNITNLDNLVTEMKKYQELTNAAIEAKMNVKLAEAKVISAKKDHANLVKKESKAKEAFTTAENKDDAMYKVSIAATAVKNAFVVCEKAEKFMKESEAAMTDAFKKTGMKAIKTA
jgi:hypothetical protein